MKKNERNIILFLILGMLYKFYEYVNAFMNFEEYKEIWMKNANTNLKFVLLYTILSIFCLVGFLRREQIARNIIKRDKKHSFEYYKLLFGISGGGFFLLQLVYLVYVAAILYSN